MSPARRKEGPAMPPSAPDARPLAACLLLLLLSASPSIQAPAAEKVSQITSVLLLHSPASIGEKTHVSCKGETVHPESGIMYWLANGTFVDQLYPNGTVKEEDTEEKGNTLTRKLIFSQLTAQDLHTKFDCLITDPSGVFQETLRWSSTKKEQSSGCPK